MNSIPLALSQVAQVVVQAINASATISAGGTGSDSVFAGVVISEKGQPFEIIQIDKSTWKRKLGAAYHPSLGNVMAEPLRHVGDAVEGGAGYVVRVVAETAKYPLLRVTQTELNTALNPSEGEPTTVTPTASALAFGSTPTNNETTDLFVLYPKDGDVSGRYVAMPPIAGKAGSFMLTLSALDKFGVENTVEELEVSFNLDAVDDMGVTTYIESRLQSQSQSLAIAIKDGADLGAFTGLTKTMFAGGDLGDQKTISSTQYEKAIEVLSNAMVGFTAVLGLGCYDTTVIDMLGDLASGRRIDAFMDIPPATSYSGALAFMTAMNLNNHDVSFYHFPYSAKDPHSGGRAVWGISGVAFQAKAAGVANSTGAVGGWHYSPAGEERGIINRREVKILAGVGTPDEKAMYKARINKLGLSSTGLLMIDDAITCRVPEDYLRFQHVSSVMNAISRQFYDLARTLKHSPDGITERGLIRGMTEILDDFVSAEALVTPRNPDEDGELPYTLTVEQTSIDAWNVQWSCCVTGTARRIMGTPSLIR